MLRHPDHVLYKWPTDPPGKAASHTIDYAQHQANSKTAGFTPTVIPASPPQGTYDPGLDASERANQRGILDLQQDNDSADSRANTAYLAGTEQNNTTTGWSLSDLLTSKNNSLTDLHTALQRSNDEFHTDSDTLGRNYASLGQAQTGKASSGAFVDTGSIAAAGAARQDNQNRDQAQLTTGYNNAAADEATQEGRVNSDYDTGVARTNQQQAWTQAGLAQTYQYGADDRATSLARATREGTAFGEDTAAARMYQATTSGLYTPPSKPANEFSDTKGPYQLIISHGLRYKLRPDGTREAAGVAGKAS